MIVLTLLMRRIEVTSLYPLLVISTSASTYRSNRDGRLFFSVEFSLLCTHVSTSGLQPTSTSLMKRIPARETVAGVAFLSELISNTILMAGDNGTRSLDTRVSTLLSSITVFIDSIHTASISPSRTTHLYV